MGKKAMGLGKGFADIISDHSMDMGQAGTETENYVSKVSLNAIDPNPFQPRKFFDEEALRELAESIKQQGIIQPVVLRKNAGRYQIVSGERRVRASRIAGLQEIEARVFPLLSDKTTAEWSLIENIQREDLDAIELANSYQQLLNSHGYTHDDLAERLGKSRVSITNSLRLLRLPVSVQKMIQEGKLSAGAARSLLSPNVSNPEKLATEIVEKGLSVRETEALAGDTGKTKRAGKKQSAEISPDMRQFINNLQNTLGMAVICKVSKKNPARGTLIINYSSYDDLTRIQNSIRPGI